jgi:hypothetical protein
MVESTECIGIDVNQRDPNYDETPLMEAARSGHLAIVKVRPPLQPGCLAHAILTPRLCTQYFIARGAEVDAVDRVACSALTHASIKYVSRSLPVVRSLSHRQARHTGTNRTWQRRCWPQERT